MLSQSLCSIKGPAWRLPHVAALFLLGWLLACGAGRAGPDKEDGQGASPADAAETREIPADETDDTPDENIVETIEEKPDGGLNIDVDSSAARQEWKGWGVALSWWASIIGGTAHEQTYADLFFTDKKVPFLGEDLPGLNVNMVRYNIGGGGQAGDAKAKEARSTRHTAYKDIDGFWINWDDPDPTSESWNWDRDAKQRSMMAAAKERGVDFFEFVAHAPMWWMMDSKSSYGGNLQWWNRKDHARHIAVVVDYARREWGIDAKSVEPFNEPSAGWWKFGRLPQEGCNMSLKDQAAVLVEQRKQLDALKLTDVIIAASDENSVDHAIRTYKYFQKEGVDNLVGRVNVHSYAGLKPYRNNVKRQELRKLVPADKEIWVTEYGDNDGNGSTLAQTILEDIQHMQVAAWMYWQPVEPDVPGRQWGLLNGDYDRDGVPLYINRKFLVFGHFTRFIRPGYRVYGTNNKNTVAAYSASERRLVLVTYNWGMEEPIIYNVPGGHNKQATVYWTMAGSDKSSDWFQSTQKKLDSEGALWFNAVPHTIYSTVIEDVTW